MGFQDLPTEILYQIFELFCQHCAEKHLATPRHDTWHTVQEIKVSRRCLINLSVTCTRWGHVAQNVLHHHFGFLETTYEQHIGFCRTISQNQELGQQLRVAKLRRIATFLNATLVENWITEPLTKYSEFISYPGSVFDMDFLTWEDYIAPLILLQTPNLEHADIHGYFDWALFSDFNIRNVVQARALPRNLKTLSVGRQTKMRYSEPEPVVQICDAKNIMTIVFSAFEHLQMLTVSNPHIHLLFTPPPFQNLRSLRLFNAHIREQDKLQILIDAAISLEEFVFWEKDQIEIAPLGRLTPRGVFEALTSRKETLKRVVLRMNATPVPFQDSRELVHPTHLADLSQLTNLEELRMNMGMLCNGPELSRRHLMLSDKALIGVFPPSLRTLCIDIAVLEFSCFGSALRAYAMSTCNEQPDQQRLEQLIVHTTSVMPGSHEWLNTVAPSERCLKAMRDVMAGEWEENSQLIVTQEQLQWHSCTERGTKSILPAFSGLDS
ncbi:hypothetical protein FHETE_9574 [Fusarium heterosporum]|uniref:F-box domain-containing protein n=1 Tax=Fusarium heterosporum TaxID=42747 RepID=A0A8H5SSD1_FUSHE|nr:hypothetical protein FHETE_9574 [Fusarium heterosporum]